MRIATSCFDREQGRGIKINLENRCEHYLYVALFLHFYPTELNDDLTSSHHYESVGENLMTCVAVAGLKCT